MTAKKAAHDSGNYHAPNSSTHKDDASITESEYEQGTRIAGWMLCAMLAFMTIWVAISSWC